MSTSRLGRSRTVVLAAALISLGGKLERRRARRSRPSASDSRWFEMSNELLVEASLDGYFTRLSERWEQCTGWTRAELMSRPFREFIHADDLAATLAVADDLDERPGEVVNFENRYRAKDGSWRWLLWNARSDHDRKYAVARDITDRKRLELEHAHLLGQVEMMARTDALTGLPNRRALDERLRQTCAIAGGARRSLVLAMVDFDHFKMFNDAHGHAAGDTLLAEAAALWRRALRLPDFLARYGGEEFVVLLLDCTSEEATALLDRLRSSTPLGETCSVGMACWDGSESPESLVARADAALYVAKNGGRNQLAAAR